MKQYEAVRGAMARIYEEPSFFGPSFITTLPDKEVNQKKRTTVVKQHCFQEQDPFTRHYVCCD